MGYKIVSETRVGMDITYNYEGLASDEKPTNAPNLSKFKEIDTDTEYFFNSAENAWIEPADKYLVSIEITTEPTKTEYQDGEEFDPTGMVITATYTDNSESTISDLTKLDIYVPSDPLSAYTPDADKHITVSYTENGITRTDSCDITIAEDVPTSISFTTAPSKPVFHEGDMPDITGAVITMTRASGRTENVTDKCEIEQNALTKASPAIIAWYQYSTDTATFRINTTTNVTVTSGELASISFTSSPTKTSYSDGEALDLTGAVIGATYTDSVTATIPNSLCTFNPQDGATLATTDTKVDVSFTDKGVTKTASCDITVT